MQKVSIIIPIGPKEDLANNLIQDLKDYEIILAAGKKKREFPETILQIESEWGRSKQLNAASFHSKSDWLWFLHADTKLSTNTLKKIDKLTQKKGNAIYYFDLKFYDGPLFLKLNETGLKIRSRLLKLPFGDQGFLIPRVLFEILGRYDENADSGEDSLFIWNAHQFGIQVIPTNETIYTSGRKYHKNGWLRTTLNHIKFAGLQSLPALGKITYRKLKLRSARAALAIFVKTPGLSEIKTRLSKSKNITFSEKFYSLAVLAIESLAKIELQTGSVIPYWAVAEEKGLKSSQWQNFEKIYQNEGALGDRLHHVYDSLLNEHESVLLIGADTPHLSEGNIHDSIDKLKSTDFVIGPAKDGGFYLFAGKKRLPHSFWNSITYSENDTLKTLLDHLKYFGSYSLLEEKTDIDDDISFESFKLEMKDFSTDSTAQRKYLNTILDLDVS